MKYTVKRNVPKNYIIYIVLVFIFITFVILGASNVTKLTNDEIINLREFTDEIFLNDQYADFSYIIKNSFVTNVKTVGFVLLCSLSYPTSFLSALIIILKGFSVGFTSGFLIFVYNTKGMLYSLLTVVTECIFIMPIMFALCSLCIRNTKNKKSTFKITLLGICMALMQIIIGIFSYIIITKI